MFSIILFLPLSGPDILTDFCYYHSCIHCSQIYYSTTHYSGCEQQARRHINKNAHATSNQIVTGSTYGCLCITSPTMLHKQNTRITLSKHSLIDITVHEKSTTCSNLYEWSAEQVQVLSVSDRNNGPMKGQEMEGSTKHISVRRVTPALLQQ